MKEQAEAKKKQQRVEIGLLKEAEKIALAEEKEILEQRKLQAQLRDIARKARSVQEKLLGGYDKGPKSVEQAPQKSIEDCSATKELVPKKKVEIKNPKKRLTTRKETTSPTTSNLELRPVKRQVTPKSITFVQFNVPKFVNDLTELFETPVEERSPHLIHEYLPDGRVFKGRITVNTPDGAKVTVSRIKSPLYVEFSYYSVKITKDGKTYVLNFDKEAGRVLESTPEGKLIVDDKHRVHYTPKSIVTQNCPIANNIPAYIDELFVRREDAQRVVLSTGLKVSNFGTKERLLAQKENEILEALKIEPDYN